MAASGGKKFQKSYFDVLGICCSSEVPLIEKILKQLDGIHDVNVIVPSRTVIVIHDSLLVSQIQIVKALNQARLEANVRVYGQESYGKKWPRPYTVACGLLVIISCFKYFFDPLKWLAVGAVAVGIWPILSRSLAAVRNLRLDVNILMLIAVGGTLAVKDYLEAGTIVFLFTIAEWLESRASHKAHVVMSSLMSMAPQKATLAETGQVVNAKDVSISTILAVKAGEVIPIDGIVVDGNCEVDEKTLTGESLPASKQNQSTVWAGTINLNGYISVKTTALADECVVAKMAKLVEEAQNKKSKTQRLIDECAQYYTPAVVLASVGVVVIPAALKTDNLKHWVHLALVILVSACPCALILSTPVATFCAFNKAATKGLLIKGGDYLEILAKIKAVAFDKTGTITRGEFSVVNFQSTSPNINLNTLLHWVSSIESKSSHPLASALVDYGKLNSIEPNLEDVKEFQNFPGEGIYGEIDGEGIYIGNKKIARRAGCESVPSLRVDENEGATVAYIFSGATLVGKFSMADVCRSGVLEAIKELKALGIKTAMLTGDSHMAAMRVQNQLENAIEEVHAELLPEEKVNFIKDLKKNGPTAMIGDGVNDSPALATADIGISMGISGSALATETGHVTLMSNDIRKIPEAIRLARKTYWKVVQNIGLSIVTKAAILALAFAGHPLVWAAVLADVGTCVLVILNSMLLLQEPEKHKIKCHKSTCSPGNGHSSHNGCGNHSHGNGHSSHNGCGLSHDKHECRSNDLHKPSSHLKDGQVKCCSHSETRTMCESKKDQTCVRKNRCLNLQQGSCEEESCKSLSMHDSCLESQESCHPKHRDHEYCVTLSTDKGSHIIEINKDEHDMKPCKNHSDDVPCGMSNLPSCESGDHHKKEACHNHVSPYTSGMSNMCKESEIKQVSDVHVHHSHEGLSENHHHHHHHRHHHYLGHTQNNGVETTSTVHGDCVHEGKSHVKCRTQDTTLQDPTSYIKDMCRSEPLPMQVCTSLAKRDLNGCCRSFRKECGGIHGCHGSSMGSLSEIVRE